MKFTWIRFALFILLFSAAFSGSSYASPTVEELNSQIQELMNRVKSLENQKESVLKKPAEEKKDSWTNSIKIAGDYRVRFDEVYFPGWNPERQNQGRWRLRIRLGFDAAINEDADFKLRLSTSEDRNVGMAGNPVSTNLTLTNVASKKPVFVDLGQLDYHPSDVKGLHVIAGKMDLPFLVAGKSDLLWDHDLTLEGGAIKFKKKNGNMDYSTALGAFMFMERPDSNDSAMLGSQIGATYNLPGKKQYITFGAGYYDFTRAKGEKVFDWQGENRNYGNTKTSGNLYAFDYNELEYFLEAGWEIGTGSKSLPVSVFGNSVKNVVSNVTNNKGWLAGLSVGKLNKPGSLVFRYDYRKLEKDAVLGAITDSDSFGGGTNGKGHRFSLERQAMKNMSMKLSYFVNRANIADDDKDNKDAEYKRLQLEVQTKF
ncbi:MAG: putative porin [Candidatus Ozemobacteraceae bacterium]